MSSPKVSVVVSVHNGQRFLREAIDSILGQTFDDFELIVIDDCSTDGSLDILRSYRDPRIHVIVNHQQRGLTRNLNTGLRLARGEYIARQDADDVSLPTRFAEQVAFLDANPPIAALGTWARSIDDGGRAVGVKATPIGVDSIRQRLRQGNCLIHPSVMFRRSMILQLGGYDETYTLSQDYDLWLRVSEHFAIENLDRILLSYRYHEDQIGRARLARQLRFARLARVSALRRAGLSHSAAWLKEVSNNLRGGSGSRGRAYLHAATVYSRRGNAGDTTVLVLRALVNSPGSLELWRKGLRLLADHTLPPKAAGVLRWGARRLRRLHSTAKLK